MPQKKTEELAAFRDMFREMRTIIKEAGWTQKRLCAALGKSESWLSKILNAGRGMDVQDLLRICEVTGIPPERLLAGYPCPMRGESEDELIAKRLHELLPEDVLRRLLEMEKTTK